MTHSSTGTAPRLAAARVLDAVLHRGRSLKAEFAKALPALDDPRDRALVEAICFAALRNRARYAAALAGFVGVLILMRPGSEVFHPAALLLLVTAVTNSLYAMLTRKLSGDSPYTTLFYSALVGTIALAPALPWAVVPDAWTWSRAGLFVLLGLFAGVGHLMLTRAYLRAPASLLAPFTYLQIVWATAFGFAFFGQLPDGWSFAGMAVIVASGLALAWQERRRARAVVRIP